MYLTNTRPHICFIVNTLSQYLVKPRRVHLIATKHVMRYMKGTIDFGLFYVGDHDYILYGYIDEYWARSASNKKISSNGCYCLGLPRSHGLAGSSLVFLSTQLEQSIYQLVLLVVKPYVFEN